MSTADAGPSSHRRGRRHPPWLPAGLLLVVLAAAGCAHAPLNAPIRDGVEASRYRPRPRETDTRRDDLLLMVFFSGGGTRAAAFSYGVLQELRATTVPVRDRRAPLLTQVDTISAVSGGAFTAAFYCLHGDATFETFEARVLKRDIQRALLWRCFRPDLMARLGSPFYGRSDLAAEFYDHAIFDGATFGDLARNPERPLLIINATDLSTGARFGFTQYSFDLIGSDLSTFPLARAVAASTAVPLLLTPVTLQNHAQSSVQPIVAPETVDDLLSDRFKRLVLDLASYGDAEHRRYIHLIDGGVADNLGLRAIQEFTMMHGGLAGMLTAMQLEQVDKIAIVVVDAAVRYDGAWNQSEAVPGTLSVLRGISASLLSRGNYETTELFKQSVQLWKHELEQRQAAAARAGAATEMKFYQINVNFAGVKDPALQTFFYGLPTGFTLPDATVDQLAAAARDVIRDHPEFQRLLRDLQ